MQHDRGGGGGGQRSGRASSGCVLKVDVSHVASLNQSLGGWFWELMDSSGAELLGASGASELRGRGGLQNYGGGGRATGGRVTSHLPVRVFWPPPPRCLEHKGGFMMGPLGLRGGAGVRAAPKGGTLYRTQTLQMWGAGGRRQPQVHILNEQQTQTADGGGGLLHIFNPFDLVHFLNLWKSPTGDPAASAHTRTHARTRPLKALKPGLCRTEPVKTRSRIGAAELR